MKRAKKIGVLVIFGFLVSMSMLAFVPVSGQVINPSNGHHYEAVPVPGGISWIDAKAAAESRMFMGCQGHLATITSQQEMDFIVANFPDAAQGEPNRNLGYWIGGFQPPGSPEPNGGWQWVTGEPFIYTNWMSFEPNNAGGEEDAIHLDGRRVGGSPVGSWNDVPGFDNRYKIPGYMVEYDTPSWKDAIVDIKPGSDPNSINVKSKGRWVAVTIEPTEGYQCTDINASTILMDGTIAPVLDPKFGWAKSEDSYCVDEDGNGVMERLLKFDRSEIEDYYMPGNHTVTITGNLYEGTPFKGSDTIRVIKPP